MNNEYDRRALLAIVLSIGVYYIWMSFISPPVPVVSPPNINSEVVDINDPVTVRQNPVGEQENAQTPNNWRTRTVDVPDRQFVFETQAWTGEIDSREGALYDLYLNNYTSSPQMTPLYSWLLSGMGDSWHPYKGGEEPFSLISDQAGFLLVGAGDDLGMVEGYLIEEDEDTMILTHDDPNGLSVIKRLEEGENQFTYDVEIIFSNNSNTAIDDLWVGVVDHMSGKAGRFMSELRPLAHIEGDVESYADLEDLDEEREYIQAPPQWFGVGDRYFMAVLKPQTNDVSGLIIDGLPNERYGSFGVLGSPLEAGATRTVTFTAYLGPKQLDILNLVGSDMAEAVELGWFGFFARILLKILKIFQAGVVNWGVAILLLTLLVKLAFFPLTQKAFTSSRRMQAVQPELKEIREKYKDNQQLLSQETMRLFKEHNVNPVGGCLPTLIQFPVWIALYNVMLYSVELYDSSFLYLQDLTVEDPFGVLPVVYAVLILGQQRMMPMANMDPMQQKVMKMMPLMFAAFMFTFPAGLVLYFCSNILLTIGQQWLINRRFDTTPSETPDSGTEETKADTA